MQEQQSNAYAKLNLTLDILRKRSDGYHDMEMVMQSISLHDVVTVRTGTGSGTISVFTDCAQLPGDASNLAWKAAQIFYQSTGIQNTGTEIFLEKHIPMQAGMAGGSTDAAAVLRVLRTQYTPEMPLEQLEAIGAEIGSDVPFCVRGGTALAEDRGERLTTLMPLPDCAILVCKPDFGLSTPALFGRIRVDALTDRPSAETVRQALERRDAKAAALAMGNVFEQVLLPDEGREICGILETMRACGAWNAVMTGSGPTVFGIFPDEEHRKQAEERLRMKYSQVFAVSPAANV